MGTQRNEKGNGGDAGALGGAVYLYVSSNAASRLCSSATWSYIVSVAVRPGLEVVCGCGACTGGCLWLWWGLNWRLCGLSVAVGL